MFLDFKFCKIDKYTRPNRYPTSYQNFGSSKLSVWLVTAETLDNAQWLDR